MTGLCKVETDVEVVFFFPVWLFKVRHYFFSSFFNLCSGADDGDFLVFLLNIIKRMVYFFERRLSADSKFSNTWPSLERAHIIDDSLNFIRVEVESLNLKSTHSFLYLLISFFYVLLTSFDK